MARSKLRYGIILISLVIIIGFVGLLAYNAVDIAVHGKSSPHYKTCLAYQGENHEYADKMTLLECTQYMKENPGSTILDVWEHFGIAPWDEVSVDSIENPNP